jgi:hypothetical protein
LPSGVFDVGYMRHVIHLLLMSAQVEGLSVRIVMTRVFCPRA